jgi:hypothetical protein
MGEVSLVEQIGKQPFSQRALMKCRHILTISSCFALTVISASAQGRPDLSGVWRLDHAESRMIGGGGPASERPQITWIVNHREPDISVVVNVRDAQGSHEFAFRCTIDGRECVNELPALREVRRITNVWEGEVLVMTQRATTPHGGFDAKDRLYLAEGGERLVFERIVTDATGERHVRQVFRKMGPHPSQRPPPPPLPTVELPGDLLRVLRDYERHWHGGNAEGLVSLFTDDGLVARRGGWIQGRVGLRDALQRTSSDLRLRPVAYAIDGDVGYIVGAYGYGPETPPSDRGMFILALRKGADGRWLIGADLDGAIRP